MLFVLLCFGFGVFSTFPAEAVPSVFSRTCEFAYPRHYTAYHMGLDEIIEIDGKIDEAAWSDVAWIEKFIDIQGPSFPAPDYRTKVKIRWDDAYLYVAAHLEEHHIWANKTEHDSVIWLDNAFEVFFSPDGSNHFYKELEINALNTTWDLEMNRPYLNGGSADNSWEMPTFKSAVYVDGPINVPSVPNRFWSIEMALPFKDLFVNTQVSDKVRPEHGDQWRMNLMRVQWSVQNVNGHYEKTPDDKNPNYWVWAPQFKINMHIPEHWGFLLFSTDQVNRTAYRRDPNWGAYSVLFLVYRAEKAYFKDNGNYTSDLSRLDFTDHIDDLKCVQNIFVETPSDAVASTFKVTVVPYEVHLPVGYIWDNRFVKFQERGCDRWCCRWCCRFVPRWMWMKWLL